MEQIFFFKKLSRIYLIWFGVVFGVKGSIFWNSNKNSPLRNVRQYIFPLPCNTLHSKNSKYAIYDTDYRRDVSLCRRVCKEIMKKIAMKEKENGK